MKFNSKDISIPVIVLCAVCLIVAGSLSVTNFFTKDTIAALNLEAEQKARTVVLPGSTSFDPGDAESTYYIGKKDDGSINGYVFATEGTGYGGSGSVRILTGISADGEVTGISFLTLNETPGLGMNAQNDSYLDQYKQPVPANGFTVIKTGQVNAGQISALTGATITTNGVTNAVNLAIQQYNTIIDSAKEVSAVSDNTAISNQEVTDFVDNSLAKDDNKNGGA